MTRYHGKHRHDINHLYPMVVQIASEHDQLRTALPALSAIALQNKAPRIELVQWFLDLIPEQEIECPVCRETLPACEFARRVCIDCALAEYTEHFL